MIGRPLLLCAAAVALASVVAGCESTQSKSERLGEEGADVLLNQEGVEIKQQSSTVDVLRSAVLADENGGAVAVELKNNSTQGLRNVPILFDVLDEKGKKVFSNDDAGLDPTLTSIAYLEPSEQTWWVHDQVLPTAEPKEVEVTLGETQEQISDPPPEVTVGEPKLELDEISGIQAVGEINNQSGLDLQDVYYYAVGTKGEEIVAAGRGASLKLKADYKRPRKYHIFFIGDPEGTDLTVTTRPTNF